MQSNEKKPSAEALAAAAPSVVETAPADKVEDVEVTLSHPLWGTVSFRAPEGRVAQQVPSAIAGAKKASDVREKVAVIDRAQDEVHEEIKRAKARVAAAEVLADAAAQATHQASVERLEKRVSALSEERSKVMSAE